MESKDNYNFYDSKLPTKSDEHIQKIIDLLSLISKPDALKIFIATRDGMKSQTSTHSEMGLSKKQYYSRLRHLVKLGLVTKDQNVYRHTMFGRIIYNDHLSKLGAEITHSKYMEMIDEIQRSSRFSKAEIDLISSKVRSGGD
ncbi:MAG: hypothetical protein KGH89_01500 [Thaumarchaeota archaeon]|nr:hypothetical protein [Nitrososphaerota archaeon]MDE1867032.1 hypothetical protein [Nitrososphaerota archaeon]